VAPWLGGEVLNLGGEVAQWLGGEWLYLGGEVVPWCRQGGSM
jgi:hypothetical protein